MRDNHYFDLILYKTYADIRAETAHTYVGYLWWLIDPLVAMATYYVVFGLFLQTKTHDFIPFLLIGVAVWQWFAATVSKGANTVRAAASLISQVYIPKLVFPTVAILIAFLHFVIVLLVLILFCIVYGLDFSPPYTALVVIVAVQFLFSGSLAYLLAALVPFIPDLRNFVDYGLRMLMFLSGVFYPAAQLPERVQTWFYLNPMANLIESYREVLIHQRWPDFGALGLVALLSCAIVVPAIYLLIRYDRVYPKVVD
jgi:lipopolysaccharide transport system permease protein